MFIIDTGYRGRKNLKIYLQVLITNISLPQVFWPGFAKVFITYWSVLWKHGIVHGFCAHHQNSRFIILDKIFHLLHLLAQFSFTTSHQKVNVWVATEVAKRIKNCYSWNPWDTCNWSQMSNRPPNRKMLSAVIENWNKTALKHSIEKPILLSFLILSTLFCGRLWLLQ